MADFREFYVQSGAGSNFLATKCLWAGDDTKHYLYDNNESTNEFSCRREKLNPLPKDNHTSWLLHYECDDENLISSAKRIKPILIELDMFIGNNHTSFENETRGNYQSDRTTVIDSINDIWRQDWSMYTSSFFHEEMYNNVESSQNVKDMILLAQDYFAKCREYYFKVCEHNSHDSFIITHTSPYLSGSPRLPLSKNVKSLAMELDEEMETVTLCLQEIKSLNFIRDEYTVLINDVSDLYVNRSIEFADDKVSYRNIFFENDENEVMKMYDFFGNKEYFEQNTTQIMKEFKEYNDNNMKVIKKNVPSLYEKLTRR